MHTKNLKTMTGKRLLRQIFSWDFEDYRPYNKGNTQNSASKRWSKKVRRFLEKELKKELLNLKL